MKRDPKNSRRPNDGAANLAMLKRTVKKLFSYYPVLAPVTFACILFSAIVTSIPSLFVQNVIQVIEKWYVSRDWVSAKAELIRCSSRSMCSRSSRSWSTSSSWPI